MLDLRHVLLADHDIAKFATRKQAAQLAKARGWNSCDVIQAFNRFSIFWCVGERLDGFIRLATRDRGDVKISYMPTPSA